MGICTSKSKSNKFEVAEIIRKQMLGNMIGVVINPGCGGFTLPSQFEGEDKLCRHDNNLITFFKQNPDKLHDHKLVIVYIPSSFMETYIIDVYDGAESIIINFEKYALSLVFEGVLSLHDISPKTIDLTISMLKKSFYASLDEKKSHYFEDIHEHKLCSIHNTPYSVMNKK
jgi:hypothetical protein